MELFEQIRREFEFCVGTISGVSRKLGVQRRMVREALSSAGDDILKRGVENIEEPKRLGLLNYLALQVRELQRWFSSAILRLVGVGLPIDFMQP